MLLNHSLTESNGQPSKTPITVFDVESNSGSIMHLVEQCREAIGADCNLTCPPLESKISRTLVYPQFSG